MSKIPTKFTEREFIIMLGVKRFKQQFGIDIPISHCDVRSITPNDHYELGYEIQTTRFDDFFRIRLYFNLAEETKLVPLRLENEQNVVGVGNPDDELYVTYGAVERYFKTEGIYRFRWMDEDINRYDVILSENGIAIVSETGELITEERS